MFVHPSSLSATIDCIAEAFFYHQSVPPGMRTETTTMIINRQQKIGTQAGFFVPYATEMRSDRLLFSGERLSTDFATNHILMLEAARILKLLSDENHGTGHALQLASSRISQMCYYNFCPKGECRALTIACLRFLVADDSGNATSRIENHLAQLAAHRDGKGKWSGFPYYFTLLMLTELPDSLPVQELQYAAPNCEKLILKHSDANPVSRRRQEILARVLERS